MDDGVYVTGLYLEGAGWDRKHGTLCEAQSMELVTSMPTIHFRPVEHKKKLTRGMISQFHYIRERFIDSSIDDYRSLYCSMLLFICSS